MALGISVRAPRSKSIGIPKNPKASMPRVKGLRTPGMANPDQQDSPTGPQLGGMGLTMGMKRGIKNQALKSAGVRSQTRQSSRQSSR
jgi:hypothetical protein